MQPISPTNPTTENMTIIITKLQPTAEHIQEQCVFRKERSCIDPNLRCKNNIRNYDRIYSASLFNRNCEIMKHNDRANRSKLWDTLFGCDLQTNLVNTVKSLNDNTNTVFNT
jgi:hypothetical protein